MMIGQRSVSEMLGISFACLSVCLLLAGLMDFPLVVVRSGHSSCGVRVSHCGGFSCCGARALACGLQKLQLAGSVAVAPGL